MIVIVDRYTVRSGSGWLVLIAKANTQIAKETPTAASLAASPSVCMASYSLGSLRIMHLSFSNWLKYEGVGSMVPNFLRFFNPLGEVISGCKCGGACEGKAEESTHDVMILSMKVFYRANRSNFMSLVGAVVLALLQTAASFAADHTDKPNILLIMADDLGVEGLGCYGGTSYATPNLDKLAQGGMKFENCHSTPKCSPSRVTLMTGRYTFRTTTQWGHIPDSEITFGSVLASAGYKTALAGKWQMALLKSNPQHVAQKGFEESCVWAWHEGPRYWKPLIYRNDTILDGLSARYGPDVFTDFLLDFMKTNKDHRFLAYYPTADANLGQAR